MNPFYQKLTYFGTLVHTLSRRKKLDMANYFTVVHPAYPVVKDTDQVRADIRFANKCPKAIKQEVGVLWHMVFG